MEYLLGIILIWNIVLTVGLLRHYHTNKIYFKESTDGNR